MRRVAGRVDQDRAAPQAPSVRPPAVAGMFYPDDPAQCRALARQLVFGAAGLTIDRPSSRPWIGAVVPHAGWIASGAIAGQSLRALAGSLARPPDVVVVFGAVHTPIELPVAALDSHARWAVPGAQSAVAQELGSRLAESSELYAVDDRLHAREHAVEVELPLIQAAWPDASVLPVEVPLTEDAPEIGRRAAEQVRVSGASAVFLASSDLTHYGPSYRFTPAGVGVAGLNWAKENDRRLLGMIERFEIEQIVPEVRSHYNACGAGAIAAMMAACKVAGAGLAKVLRHASSFETLAKVAPQPPVDAVGYAAVVVR